MEKYEKMVDIVKTKYRPTVLFLLFIIVFEIYFGIHGFYYDLRTMIIAGISNEMLQLLGLFLLFLMGFLLIVPAVSFLISWGTYEIAGIRYSLRVRSVFAYIWQFFSSFKWRKVWLILTFARIQLRQAFSVAIFGISLLMYIFFLFIIIFVMIQIPENVFSSSTNIGILWTFLIGLSGAGVPLAVFFIRYINENLSGITIREYLKTHVILTLVIIINIIFAVIFSVGWIYSEDQVVAIAASIFLLFSCVSLALLYVSILIIPFRGKFKGPRRRAAKSVIHRRALSEARSQICDWKINQYTNTEKVTTTTPDSKKVTAADLELKSGEHITDINLKKLRSTLNEYHISHFSLALSLGEKINHKDILVIEIKMEKEENVDNEFFTDLSNSLVSNRLTSKYGTPNESPENYLPFDGIISDVEKECKQAIDDGNRSMFLYRFQTYISFFFFIVLVADLQEIPKDDSHLPFDHLYASIRRIFNKIGEKEDNILNETTLKIGAAAVDSLYVHQQLIQNEYGENRHTHEIHNLLHYFQRSVCDDEITNHIKSYTNQIEDERITREERDLENL